MSYQEILAWVQILVGLGSCAALVFYAGKLSQVVKDVVQDVVELKASRKEQWEKLNNHGERILILEKTTPKRGPIRAD